jgi:hypothetical protein
VKLQYFPVRSKKVYEMPVKIASLYKNVPTYPDMVHIAFSDFVHCFVLQKNTVFRELALFPSSREGVAASFNH